jgi:hypothetical protein
VRCRRDRPRLTNLFDNARKYSPEGTPITVTVSSDARRVAIDVHNAGGGIAEEDREAIFERFRRADETEAPGTGLGLYISRGLVRAHGGELEVGDAPEDGVGGTRFTFWLPVLDPGEREVSVGPAGASAPVDPRMCDPARCEPPHGPDGRPTLAFATATSPVGGRHVRRLDP